MESVRIVRLPSQDAVSLSFLDTETPAIRIEAKLLQKSRLVADILSEELDNKDSIGDEDAGAVLYTPPGFFSSWLQHVRNPSTDLESVSQMVLILQASIFLGDTETANQMYDELAKLQQAAAANVQRYTVPGRVGAVHLPQAVVSPVLLGVSLAVRDRLVEGAADGEVGTGTGMPIGHDWLNRWMRSHFSIWNDLNMARRSTQDVNFRSFTMARSILQCA